MLSIQIKCYDWPACWKIVYPSPRYGDESPASHNSVALMALGTDRASLSGTRPLVSVCVCVTSDIQKQKHKATTRTVLFQPMVIPKR